jgi:hypothetical protein
MTKKNLPRFEDIQDPGLLSSIVYESQAYQIYLHLERLSLYFYIFKKNYVDLIKLLRGAQSLESYEMIWILSKQDEMTKVLMEITRLLQNFLSSAPALVQHTRKSLRNWYSDDPFLDKYQEKVDELFLNDAISGFIEDLRNYNLHYIVPVTIATFKQFHDPESDQQKSAQAMIINAKELWDSGWEWKKGSEFLTDSEEEIVIEAIVSHYYSKAETLYDWIQDTLRKKHSDEIDWLDYMSDRVATILGKK